MVTSLPENTWKTTTQCDQEGPVQDLQWQTHHRWLQHVAGSEPEIHHCHTLLQSRGPGPVKYRLAQYTVHTTWQGAQDWRKWCTRGMLLMMMIQILAAGISKQEHLSVLGRSCDDAGACRWGGRSRLTTTWRWCQPVRLAAMSSMSSYCDPLLYCVYLCSINGLLSHQFNFLTLPIEDVPHAVFCLLCYTFCLCQSR